MVTGSGEGFERLNAFKNEPDAEGRSNNYNIALSQLKELRSMWGKAMVTRKGVGFNKREGQTLNNEELPGYTTFRIQARSLQKHLILRLKAEKLLNQHITNEEVRTFSHKLQNVKKQFDRISNFAANQVEILANSEQLAPINDVNKRSPFIDIARAAAREISQVAEGGETGRPSYPRGEALSEYVKNSYSPEDLRMLLALYRDGNPLAFFEEGYRKPLALIRREIRAVLVEHLKTDIESFQKFFSTKLQPIFNEIIKAVEKSKQERNEELQQYINSQYDSLLVELRDFAISGGYIEEDDLSKRVAAGPEVLQEQVADREVELSLGERPVVVADDVDSRKNFNAWIDRVINKFPKQHSDGESKHLPGNFARLPAETRERILDAARVCLESGDKKPQCFQMRMLQH